MRLTSKELAAQLRTCFPNSHICSPFPKLVTVVTSDPLTDQILEIINQLQTITGITITVEENVLARK